MPHGLKALLAVLPVTALAGCAADSPGLLQTASVAPAPRVAKAATAQPAVAAVACLDLANRIDTLRAEGTIDRLEKVAHAKTRSVSVKRGSLAKQVELNKANLEFQKKCATVLPQTAALAAPAPAAVPAATSTVGVKNAATVKALAKSSVAAAKKP